MIRLAAIAGLLFAACSFAAQAAHVALIEIDGPIGPATSAHLAKAHARAVEEGVAAIVLRIDTPGGLDTAMRDIIKLELSSPIPVIAWVGPEGARAASAGTYILYAAHIAAMAPATNLGAATPIPVGGGWPATRPGATAEPASGEHGGAADKAADGASHEGGEAVDAAQAKAVNDAVAYLRSLAEKRARNADWAERAVREGASLSAERALELGVIDVVAEDIDTLLRAIEGRRVEMPEGGRALALAGLPVQRIDPDWRMRLLAVITNPTVAYVLMLIGIYGLLLEGYHPGAILPGVTGAICLLLALYAFQLLPVNYVGLGLILLGVALMIAEALAPSFGVLGFGGGIAFVLGSVLLMDIDVPGYEINVGVISGIALTALALLAATLYLLWRARRARVVTGDERMVGQIVRVLEAADGEGWAEVAGERWRIQAATHLRAGQSVRVSARNGLILTVVPIE
ncbi:nodulation protein NfeD [Fontimonas sp. SYSU GA230001]|uniref:NfeD family protein n=1 Tax=Fontimonas sp. SYSU GA230001 TaxID=3142450 RepID=UPI0032B45AB3